MNMSEMGEVYAYLLRYRMAESRPNNRNRRATRAGLISERDVCATLAQASEEEISQLRQFLNGQGLQLVFVEAADYPGISAGGRMYLLQRLPEADLPALFSQQPVYSSMRLRQESQEEIALWFLHLWLLLMGLLYTRNNRSLTDVSQYQEAVITLQELVTAMRQHIEQLRQNGALGSKASPAIRALIDEKGEDIPRRVRVFVELMEQAGHLQRCNDKTDSDTDNNLQPINTLQASYQQTLLGALEAEQIGLHHLHHLLNDLNQPETEQANDDTLDTEQTDTEQALDKNAAKGASQKADASEETASAGKTVNTPEEVKDPQVNFENDLFSVPVEPSSIEATSKAEPEIEQALENDQQESL